MTLFKPVWNPEEEEGSSDTLLQHVCDAIERPTKSSATDRSWISTSSFNLMKEKAKALRRNDSDEVNRLGKALRRSIRKDRRDRIWKVLEFVEASLQDGDIIGAYNVLRHWYKKFTGKALSPTKADLDTTRDKFTKLFQQDEFPDTPPYDFPYTGPPVNDTIPTEDEIRYALFKMRSRKASGLTKLSVDHLKQWYKEGHPKEGEGNAEAIDLWQKIVTIIQRCIFEGDIPQAFFYGVLVIIPKGDSGDVRGIGLLEVIHKLIPQIINLRMANSIQFLEEVHGFRRGRGTFTAIGETKLRLQMAVNNSETTYQVYLDLKKAYDSIDRKRVIHIMKKYGVGPNICRYVQTVWDNQFFLLRQNGFYSDPLQVSRGCTQGDIDSPIIFNIIVDAVLRTWKVQNPTSETRCCFYADDGLLEGNDPVEIQADLDKIIELFGQVGLRANEKKIKYMIVRGANAPQALSTAVYDNIATRRLHRYRNGKSTYIQRRKNIQTCITCGATLQAASMRRHQIRQHNKEIREYKCIEVGATGIYYVNDIQRKNFNKCPVEGCSGGATDKSTFYRHFCLRHPNADIIIHSDGELPKCEKCGMRCFNLQRHRDSPTCKKAQQRRKHEYLQQEQAKANTINFTVNGKSIERVREFKYLGRIFSDDDNDTISIKDNIRKARQKWNSIAKILKREGANSVCMARFYLTVVQAVLLYGADSWSITEQNMTLLRGFHWRAIRYMTNQHIRKENEKEWTIPDHLKLLKKCHLFPIEVYIERRRGTLRRYLENHRRDLLLSAEATTRHSRAAHSILWWKQTWITKSEMNALSLQWELV